MMKLSWHISQLVSTLTQSNHQLLATDKKVVVGDSRFILQWCCINLHESLFHKNQSPRK